MLDEWDEDNNLAQLGPVVETAGSIFTSFTNSTFGSHTGGATSGMVHWRRWKDPPVPRRRVDEQIWIWAYLTNSERRKAGLREVSWFFFTQFHNF